MVSTRQVWLAMVLSLAVCALVDGRSDAQPSAPVDQRKSGIGQVVLQIGGRYCEYHRDEVVSALRRSPAVKEVEFLNDHGTVLVRYDADGGRPAEFAESVEHALASGIGCKTWVDRGGRTQG